MSSIRRSRVSDMGAWLVRSAVNPFDYLKGRVAECREEEDTMSNNIPGFTFIFRPSIHIPGSACKQRNKKSMRG